MSLEKRKMLISFSVSNYKSFDGVQTFSMEAGKVRSFIDRVYIARNIKLLKFMAVYGANASGKTNLVSAFEFARQTIVSKLPAEAKECYCRISANNKEMPSLFEFVIEISDVRYKYGFVVNLNSSSFQAEWLRELSYGDKYKTIFERNVCDGTFTVDTYFRDAELNRRLKMYAEDISTDDSALFLTVMNQSKGSLYESSHAMKIYKDIFLWFKYRFSVNSPDKPVTNFSFINDSVEVIGEMLSMFGTGVSQVHLVEVSVDKVFSNVPKELMKDVSDHLLELKKRFSDKKESFTPTLMLRNTDNDMFILELSDEDQIIAKTLEFNHSNTDAVFALSEESDGTVRLLDLIEILITAERDQVYIIDEINRRFHPLLTYRFVEKYLELAEKRHMQLIVTTHESKILDFDLLRKDEINFVNKDEYGKSEIYSLERFGERFDKKICAAYLKGDYGAIPTFNRNASK